MNVEQVPRITESENILFKCLDIFKFLDIEFVSNNIYPGRQYYYVTRRISQLEHHDYIRSTRLYDINAYNSTNGVKIITAYDGAKDFLDFNLHEVSSDQRKSFSHIIAHQLFLAKVLFPYYSSSSYTDQHVVEFVSLLSEKELSISGKHNNFRPDGGLILNVDGNNIVYFVEVERSYAKESDVVRKVFKQYNNIQNIVNKLKVFDEMNIASARVLFISSTKNKMNNLKDKIKKMNLTIEIDILFIYLDKLLDDSIDNILDVNYVDLNDNPKKIFSK